MPAAYELEQIIVRSLNAYGQAVHAFGTQELERGEADAVRIALDSDLGIETDIAVELERVEYLDDPVRPVVAGSTAAEVYRVDLLVLYRLRGLINMIEQRLLIVRHDVVAALERIEVAVAALAGAERYMDVYSQPFFHRRYFSE